MKLSPLMFLLLGAATPAWARLVHLDTARGNMDVIWTVSEVSGGKTVTAAPAYLKKHSHTGGKDSLTIPFTDNDGVWIAETSFHLSSVTGSTTLTIARTNVDDRDVIELNGTVITSCGGRGDGNGFMTLKDGGPNEPYTFTCVSGRQNLVINTGFVAGTNRLKVIVNNTNDGIQGAPVAPSPGDLTLFGLTARVRDTPAP